MNGIIGWDSFKISPNTHIDTLLVSLDSYLFSENNDDIKVKPNDNIENINNINILKDNTQDKINDKVLKGIPNDVNDIFGHNNNLRQFYTIPNNDQGSFIEWCYSNNNHCKEGINNDCTGFQGRSSMVSSVSSSSS